MTHAASPTLPAASALADSTAELYDALCARARGLSRDRAYMGLLRGLTPGEALRCALDAEPALELLPPNLLAEVLGPALSRAGRA